MISGDIYNQSIGGQTLGDYYCYFHSHWSGFSQCLPSALSHVLVLAELHLGNGDLFLNWCPPKNVCVCLKGCARQFTESEERKD